MHEFAIDLPELSDEDDILPSAYFSRVERAISTEPRWSIDSKRIQLGFFSFSKFLMVRDLVPENWLKDLLTEHPLIRALLFDAFGSSEPLFSNEAKLDDVLDPRDLFHVVDADASQAVVIETVRRGRNLVVQGPPGTGKSQTITNIIASAVNDGKHVLFLSEKRAALAALGCTDPALSLTSETGIKISGASHNSLEFGLSNHFKNPTARNKMFVPCSSSALLASR